MLEDLLDASWDMSIGPPTDTTMVHVTRRLDWIDWGRMRGDPTALKYYETLEHVGITPTVVYHDMAVKIMSMPERGQREEKSLAEFKAQDHSRIARLPADE